MTYQATATRYEYSENPLCDRLRMRFKNRGMALMAKKAVPGMNNNHNRTAYGTKTQHGRTSERSRDNDAARTVRTTKTAAKAAFTYHADRYADADVREQFLNAAKARRIAETPFDSGAYTYAYARAAKIRARAKKYRDAQRIIRRNNPDAFRKKEAPKSKAAVLAAKDTMKEALSEVFSKEKAPREEKLKEVRLAKKPFPKGLVALVSLCTVMIMVMVFSFSEVYELNREISELDSQRLTLTDTETKLSSQLEMRDDLSEIEKTATEKLGMVKSDLVQTKYVSVKGGEKIEVIDDKSDEKNDPGALSTMLSAIGDSFGNILDYIQ